MEKKRLYVGNLPHVIDEEIIKNRFSKYGNVLSVDLKQRNSSFGDNNILSTFAFVDIQASETGLLKCMKKLSKKKWLNNEVTIQFAKESVISRLENERKANVNNRLGKSNHGTFKQNIKSGYNNFINNEDNSRLNGSLGNRQSPSQHSSILTKLEEFSDVWNDCDDFSSRSPPKSVKYDTDNFNKVAVNGKTNIRQRPVQIDRDCNDDSRNLTPDYYAKLSDEKRLKSVEEMKNAINQKKQLIKQALSAVDSITKNKKIVFDDDGNTDIKNHMYNELENHSQNDTEDGTKQKLFNDDSDDEEEGYTFNTKQRFEGKRGKKLFELQSKIGNDERFAVDERFYESDEDVGDKIEDKTVNTAEHLNVVDEDGGLNKDDEVKRQLEILQNIVGTDVIHQRKKQRGEQRPLTAAGLRFDPSLPDHEKFIVKPTVNEEDVDSKANKRKRKKQIDESQEDTFNGPQVSKETFYEVTDKLRNTFKSSEKKNFTFSELFNSSSDKNIKDKVEIDNIDSFKKRTAPYNQFNDDRFRGNFNEDHSKEVSEEAMTEVDPDKRKLWHDDFFFKESDSRFEEVHDFFSKPDIEVESPDFAKKRQELKKIVKKKVMNKNRKDRLFKRNVRGIKFKKNKTFKNKRRSNSVWT